MKIIKTNTLTKKIALTLINDERKTKRILSAKACINLYSDALDCQSGTVDDCYGKDLTKCSGLNAQDICKYIDQESCSGYYAYDYCEYDYDLGNNCNSRDYCGTDY